MTEDVSKKDLAELVRRSKEGDAEAFALVYDELVKPVYRYIYYRVEPQIAEDLTEETFLKAWQNLSQYQEGKNPFSSWVFRIAHNLVCDHYRKHQAQNTVEIDENIPDAKADSSPAYQLNVKLNQVRLRKAIRNLPENYQQIIVLKYINEENNDVIATTIGKSEGAVRTLQFRALEKLRELLKEKKDDF